MSFVSIPYEIKNGVESTATQYLLVDTSDYAFCGSKYFELMITSVSKIGANFCTYFNFQGDNYGCYSETTNDLIAIINSVFVCEPSTSCAVQLTKFDWELTPLVNDSWTSDAIVNEVLEIQTNQIYRVTTLTVEGVNYGTLPHTIWDDSIEATNASVTLKDYFDKIIAYIESFNIPKYIGAVNHAQNGMADNLWGTDLLELYFEVGTVVDIKITSTATPSGIFNFNVAKTTQLQLELTDDSTIDLGDAINQITWVASDGTANLVNNELPVANLFPYSVLITPQLNKASAWVLYEIIVTDNVCQFNNVATCVIPSTEIIDCIDNQTTKSGTSL